MWETQRFNFQLATKFTCAVSKALLSLADVHLMATDEKMPLIYFWKLDYTISSPQIGVHPLNITLAV